MGITVGIKHPGRLYSQMIVAKRVCLTAYNFLDSYPKTDYSGKQLRVEVSNLTDASEHPVPWIAQ